MKNSKSRQLVMQKEGKKNNKVLLKIKIRQKMYN